MSPQGAGQQLSTVLASSNPVVRMRAIALVIGLGAQAEKSVKALQQSGQYHFLRFHPMLHHIAETAFSSTCCHQGCILRRHIHQHHDLASPRLPVRGGYATCMSSPVPKVCISLQSVRLQLVCAWSAQLSHMPEVYVSSAPSAFVYRDRMTEHLHGCA